MGVMTLLLLLAALGASLAAAPRLTHANYRLSTVDVVFRPPEAMIDPTAATTKVVKYRVAVIDAFASQALFFNGSVALPDANHFVRLHRNHRQLFYGLTRLDCGERRFESHPHHGLPFVRASSSLRPNGPRVCAQMAPLFCSPCPRPLIPSFAG
jgi:hypothetical protein